MFTNRHADISFKTSILKYTADGTVYVADKDDGTEITKGLRKAFQLRK
jgi:hypothetical protein